jgi:hypothetical protein
VTVAMPKSSVESVTMSFITVPSFVACNLKQVLHLYKEGVA